MERMEAHAINMLNASKYPYERKHIELLAADLAGMIDKEGFHDVQAVSVLTRRIGGLGALMRYIACLR